MKLLVPANFLSMPLLKKTIKNMSQNKTPSHFEETYFNNHSLAFIGRENWRSTFEINQRGKKGGTRVKNHFKSDLYNPFISNKISKRASHMPIELHLNQPKPSRETRKNSQENSYFHIFLRRTVTVIHTDNASPHLFTKPLLHGVQVCLTVLGDHLHFVVELLFGHLAKVIVLLQGLVQNLSLVFPPLSQLSQNLGLLRLKNTQTHTHRGYLKCRLGYIIRGLA